MVYDDVKILPFEQELCLRILPTIWSHSMLGWAVMDESGRFLAVNPTFSELLEYTPSELMGTDDNVPMSFRDVLHPKDVKAAEKMHKMLLDGHLDYYIMSKSYLTKNQNILPTKVKVTILRKKEQSYLLCQLLVPVFFTKSQPNRETETDNNPFESGFFNFLVRQWKSIAIFGTILGGILWEIISRILKISR